MFSSKRRLVFALTVLAVVIMSTVGCIRLMVDGPKDSWEGVVKHIRPATVEILVGEVDEITERDIPVSSGSGFVITSTGLIVTAAHVVDGVNDLYRPWIEVRFHNGDKYRVDWVRGDVDHDVAVIKIDAVDLPILEFEEDQLMEGEPILAMGSNGISTWAVTDGIVSKVEMWYDLKLGHGWLQMTVPLNPGFSGGPVVNVKGRVVGVSVAYLPLANEVYLAAPGPIAKSLIQQLLKPDPKVRPVNKISGVLK